MPTKATCPICKIAGERHTVRWAAMRDGEFMWWVFDEDGQEKARIHVTPNLNHRPAPEVAGRGPGGGSR